ncbi:hypothetical protein [Streptomyces sp. NBC_01235]|nr:hypothetical protein OG289_39755 [Streptomyces sp. NBC_01235]
MAVRLQPLVTALKNADSAVHVLRPIGVRPLDDARPPARHT